MPKKIASIEAGGKLKHFRLSSSHIIKDLKKNLARFGVAGDVTLINGRSFDEATIPEVRQAMDGGEVLRMGYLGRPVAARIVLPQSAPLKRIR